MILYVNEVIVVQLDLVFALCYK